MFVGIFMQNSLNGVPAVKTPNGAALPFVPLRSPSFPFVPPHLHPFRYLDTAFFANDVVKTKFAKP